MIQIIRFKIRIKFYSFLLYIFLNIVKFLVETVKQKYGALKVQNPNFIQIICQIIKHIITDFINVETFDCRWSRDWSAVILNRAFTQQNYPVFVLAFFILE